ncbi:amidohydrolase/deacetylase family metallohydrolase [Paenibacillus agaridevorans]|uniref:Amidohydrolase/deacetylase family metallohydrolase n=1 Tax=Paenibacillus agaridevorans TaxID=171404 RepID=A0A2R5ELD2_9BACL|nr:amidohydrolase/deacetylase family metallohydrolase [Paenibacillus agaridevorans]GBG07442.1 amidohydrolase/deacetylase family metallohydrolase [Paenibacillus agaridevorans]
MQEQERYILRDLRLLDGQPVDIAIQDGRIAGVWTADAAIQDRQIAGVWTSGQAAKQWEDAASIDCSGQYVSSGWIDMHVHAFPELDPYGDEIDAIGVEQGVATIVDAGSCGADRIGELLANGQKARTNLLAFLNIAHIGLHRIDELSDLAWIDGSKLRKALEAHQSSIVGLKARISKSVVKDSGIEPLRLARRFSEETGLPLMVHIGSGPPAIEDVVRLLADRDIITHYLNGKANNLFNGEGRPLQVLADALARGVRLDVGHGTASFSFRVADTAKRHGIPLHTISSDIYRGNRKNGPVYSLANVMTKFLHLGYTLEEVVAAVTSNAAEWLGKPELGRIVAGDTANLTLFEVRQERTELVDSEGERRIADQLIQAKGVVVDGKFIKCEVRP